MTTTDYTLAELCITAAAEAWRDAGEVLASGLGLVPGSPSGSPASPSARTSR